MTSHHDVAVVVAQLRAISGYPIFRDFGDGAAATTSLRAAADLLESQAKALSEWKQAASVEAGLRREFYDRALAAEARLAEAMRVIGFYADRRRYEGPNLRPIPDDPFAKPDAVYIHDVTRDGGANARAFTNAAKEKT